MPSLRIREHFSEVHPTLRYILSLVIVLSLCSTENSSNSWFWQSTWSYQWKSDIHSRNEFVATFCVFSTFAIFSRDFLLLNSTSTSILSTQLCPRYYTFIEFDNKTFQLFSLEKAWTIYFNFIIILENCSLYLINTNFNLSWEVITFSKRIISNLCETFFSRQLFFISQRFQIKNT